MNKLRHILTNNSYFRVSLYEHLFAGYHSTGADVHEDGVDSPDWGVSGGDGWTHTVFGGQGNVQHAEKSHGTCEAKTFIIHVLTNHTVLRTNSSLQ